MLFAKKKAPLGTSAKDGIVDVVDVSESSPAQVEPPLGEPTDAPAHAVHADSAPRGLFLDAKPTVAAPAATKSLRDRFTRKAPVDQAAAAAEAKPAPVQKKREKSEASAQPAVEARPGLRSRLSWPGRKAEAPATAVAAGAAASSAAVAEAAPVRPTENVRKPIIVRKATDKKRKFQELPIRVFIGFLPEVTERDARDYALGIAERNCEQISLVYYDAFKMKEGFAYEVHEGGAGRAFVPEIIEHFAAQAPFAKGSEETSVFIRTATRMVQVERTHDGLQAFQLPESATEPATDWLEGSTKMTSAVQKMTSVLVIGAAIFATGFMAMALAMVSRIQPYEPAPAPVVERATDGFNMSPLSRWTTLQGVSGDEYVKALRYSNGKWELERGTAAAPFEAPAATDIPAPALN